MTPTPNAPQSPRPADQRRSATGRHARRRTRTLVLTSGFLVVEVAAGFWTGSLALLADAEIEHITIQLESEALVQIVVRQGRLALLSSPQGTVDHGDPQDNGEP